jgi:hypothetical protein
MANDWINHCKAYSKANNCSYKEAMSRAKPSYKKGGCCEMEGDGYVGDKIREFISKVKTGRNNLKTNMIKSMAHNKGMQQIVKK